jgi:hypothetical protein
MIHTKYGKIIAAMQRKIDAHLLGGGSPDFTIALNDADYNLVHDKGIVDEELNLFPRSLTTTSELTNILSGKKMEVVVLGKEEIKRGAVLIESFYRPYTPTTLSDFIKHVENLVEEINRTHKVNVKSIIIDEDAYSDMQFEDSLCQEDGFRITNPVTGREQIIAVMPSSQLINGGILIHRWEKI